MLPPCASNRSISHRRGNANAARQNALATGPVSASRTKIGANAMQQPPASRQRKAAVDPFFKDLACSWS
jgi:hypothetical protein